ncbi:MAG: hypothetical protein A3C80_01430 [Candidatus Ryanbacteria bacterium RIFCSPHIGHO2_02_FULL_45_43]|uniref:Uncharacterized protein n=1 Tax=Candidatus Ryanbacteria bacterium RIFCSPHIGHO2_01_45_13 TaxID=1802112 RepID=A0A1G2FXG0_9BACT|nr:MAG: hypothetical protein A2W41_00905 [Candidatus Ryanbacteria bacterium RIFCSPHIGHO2_01_45_13]OGZ42364.1 MAG: hypothetical protein A2718_02255 [Candidatus Ryanbacteria bacterium RIFCSPHIGHO2_01_FULL_44_130]OGZ48339.1 MAG: hypothetical protein A3C80_01430 [Candidatus Ryanbacteria bacterium RIFCSPHIGHO2_02_FULL_45_43]OGZ50449.1 MAG: hypothetical protein A3E55_03610 [Candidatus Ryanbacteria bacterium RIFCSPHIGHO2_12_FULL_44_20]OGZ52101.1 MAG: hypothetical protein A3A17_01465 [Candidatus Ryanba
MVDICLNVYYKFLRKKNGKKKKKSSEKSSSKEAKERKAREGKEISIVSMLQRTPQEGVLFDFMACLR